MRLFLHSEKVCTHFPVLTIITPMSACIHMVADAASVINVIPIPTIRNLIRTTIVLFVDF